MEENKKKLYTRISINNKIKLSMEKTDESNYVNNYIQKVVLWEESELIELIKNNAINMSVFKNNYRLDLNVIFTSGIMLDFDNNEIIEIINNNIKLLECNYLLFSSKNYSDNFKKFRLWVPFDKIIESIDSLKIIYGYIHNIFPSSDNRSFVRSQYWFPSDCKIFILEQEKSFLNIDNILMSSGKINQSFKDSDITFDITDTVILYNDIKKRINEIKDEKTSILCPFCGNNKTRQHPGKHNAFLILTKENKYIIYCVSEGIRYYQRKENKNMENPKEFVLQPWETITENMQYCIPRSPESETAVMIAILRNPDLLKEIDYLVYEHFQTKEYKIIYHAIKLAEKDGEVDIVSIGEKLLTLKDNVIEVSGENIFHKAIERLVNIQQVSSIQESENYGQNRIKYYADVIIKNYSARRLLEKIPSRYKSIFNPTQDISDTVLELIDDCQTYLSYIPKKEHDLDLKCDNATILLDGSLIVRTGLGIDKKELKFIKNRINTIGGLPGHLKTTLAVQIAINLCETNNKVLFYSLEMSCDDLLVKMACNLSNLSFERAIEGHLDNKEISKFKEALNYIKTKYKDLLYIFDDVFDVNRMIQIISQIKPSVTFIDYFQLMAEDQKSLRADLNNILTKFGRFIKFSGTALILLSQISRDVEKREDAVPRNSDLAETAKLERDSANIMFSYYDWVRCFINERVAFLYGRLRYGKEILIMSKTKGRYSPPFRIKLYIEPESGRIRTMTSEEWRELLALEKSVREV